jgi:hypothetical protein
MLTPACCVGLTVTSRLQVRKLQAIILEGERVLVVTVYKERRKSNSTCRRVWWYERLGIAVM